MLLDLSHALVSGTNTDTGYAAVHNMWGWGRLTLISMVHFGELTWVTLIVHVGRENTYITFAYEVL